MRMKVHLKVVQEYEGHIMSNIILTIRRPLNLS